MSTITDIINGLTLIESKGGGFDAAEHDEIWAGEGADFTPEEVEQMEEWGWDISEYDSFHRFV